MFLNIRDLPELFFLDRFGPELKSVTLSRSLAGASIFSSEPVKVLLDDFHEEGSGSGSFSETWSREVDQTHFYKQSH